MPDKAFIDSNIIIYLYSEDEPDKRERCQQLVRTHQSIISTQVINEVSNVLYRKMNLTVSELRAVVGELFKAFTVTLLTQDSIKLALLMLERYAYSYWDSMILASALEKACSILYSEDMQHKQRIEGKLQIVNPFQ